MKKLITYMQRFLNRNALCGMAFLINPSIDLVKEDYSESVQSAAIERPFEMGDEYFKTPLEIDEFIVSSNGVKRKNLQAYFDVYRPLILSASNIFKIPFSFQSCLIYKESRFNKKALSPVGAMGVAQFTKDTYDFLARALAIGKNALEVEGQKMLEGNTSSLPTETKRLTYSKYNVKIFSEMYEMWQTYLITNDLDDMNLQRTAYRKFLYKPNYAIGFSSMYLYYLKHRVKYNLDKQVTDKELEDPDFILTMAGAYNQGARRVLKAIKKTNAVSVAATKSNFSNWISYQSRVSETRDYISSIRGCMRSDLGRDKKKLVFNSQKAEEKESSFN